MLLLAIETSCDDTAAAVFDGAQLLAQTTASQTVHADWGGVVPELASRAHQVAIGPTVRHALTQAGKALQDLELVAYTQGPGLLGALLVGQSYAKGLALALQVPLLGINHMQAHVLANFIEQPAPPFPFLCLTVSGGHTQIVRVNSPTEMQILGQTRDDAAGEAFDKCAKMLGLPYPGGPLIDKLAAQGNLLAYAFPVAEMPGLEYSFSGLKTAVRVFLDKQGPEAVQQHLADICASVQHTIVKTLLAKLKKAATETGISHIALAGGVAANSGLRAGLQAMATERGWQTYIPTLAFCTDNAAMVGMAAHLAWQAGRRGTLADTAFVSNDAAPVGLGFVN
jgi:N6-L-threonylcarbamoyladenine synthase